MAQGRSTVLIALEQYHRTVGTARRCHFSTRSHTAGPFTSHSFINPLRHGLQTGRCGQPHRLCRASEASTARTAFLAPDDATRGAKGDGMGRWLSRFYQHALQSNSTAAAGADVGGILRFWTTTSQRQLERRHRYYTHGVRTVDPIGTTIFSAQVCH